MFKLEKKILIFISLLLIASGMWGVFDLVEKEIVTIKEGFGLLVLLLVSFLIVQYYLKKENKE